MPCPQSVGDNTGGCRPRVRGVSTVVRHALVLISESPGGSSVARSKRAKCMEKVARPWLSERSSVEYPNILESATSASTTLARGFGVIPSILALRADKPLMTPPKNSSGTTTSTAMMGSSRTGCALRQPSVNAWAAATSYPRAVDVLLSNEPPRNVTRTSTTG